MTLCDLGVTVRLFCRPSSCTSYEFLQLYIQHDSICTHARYASLPILILFPRLTDERDIGLSIFSRSAHADAVCRGTVARDACGSLIVPAAARSTSGCGSRHTLLAERSRLDRGCVPRRPSTGPVEANRVERASACDQRSARLEGAWRAPTATTMALHSCSRRRPQLLQAVLAI